MRQRPGDGAAREDSGRMPTADATGTRYPVPVPEPPHVRLVVASSPYRRRIRDPGEHRAAAAQSGASQPTPGTVANITTTAPGDAPPGVAQPWANGSASAEPAARGPRTPDTRKGAVSVPAGLCTQAGGSVRTKTVPSSPRPRLAARCRRQRRRLTGPCLGIAPGARSSGRRRHGVVATDDRWRSRRHPYDRGP